ncbi:hypothetical protein lerEdw1_003006 [Lerista edwardsae]|nr:hypothetical protein lerEdw1_003006 [Lerista edwardsae]
MLLMVDLEGYQGCYETPGAFKRWECSRPYAPYGPVRFSEKIQRFTPFSLGFEFQPGRDYYYISIPTSESPGRCLKLRVSVCCKATTVKPETEGPQSQPRGRGRSEGELGGWTLSGAKVWLNRGEVAPLPFSNAGRAGSNSWAAVSRVTVRFCIENAAVAPGRSSAPACLVCPCLGLALLPFLRL